MAVDIDIVTSAKDAFTTMLAETAFKNDYISSSSNSSLSAQSHAPETDGSSEVRIIVGSNAYTLTSDDKEITCVKHKSFFQNNTGGTRSTLMVLELLYRAAMLEGERTGDSFSKQETCIEKIINIPPYLLRRYVIAYQGFVRAADSTPGNPNNFDINYSLKVPLSCETKTQTINYLSLIKRLIKYIQNHYGPRPSSDTSQEGFGAPSILANEEDKSGPQIIGLDLT